MVRLAIDPEIIEQAKRASGQRTFSDTIKHAAERFLPTIAKSLHAAGFQPTDANYRIFPVSIATIEAIDNASDLCGVSRNAVIRALLVLKAREVTPAEQSEEDAQFKAILAACSELSLKQKRRRREPKPKPKKREPKQYTCNGETLTASEWAKKLGRSRERIRQRLEKYPVEVALYAVPPAPPLRTGRFPEKRRTCNGETLTTKEWAEKLKITVDTLRYRLKHSSPEIVLSGNWERRRKMYVLDDQAMTLPQWAEKMGTSLDIAYMRIRAATGRIGAGRPSKLLEFNGETRTLVGWAKKLGLTTACLIYRLEHHPIEIALSAPKGMATLRNSHDLGSETDLDRRINERRLDN
jgi:hypothetical protein